MQTTTSIPAPTPQVRIMPPAPRVVHHDGSDARRKHTNSVLMRFAHAADTYDHASEQLLACHLPPAGDLQVVSIRRRLEKTIQHAQTVLNRLPAATRNPEIR